MKRISNFTALISVCILLAFSSTAQAQQKIGHVDSDAVIAAMPEYKAAKSELESYSKILEEQLVEGQTKAQEYYNAILKKIKDGVMTPKEQRDEEAKLQQMQQDLQEEAVEADEKVAEKEIELTKPIFDKFNAALEKVAEANGLAYILDIKLALYSGGGEDVTPLVKTELGID